MKKGPALVIPSRSAISLVLLGFVSLIKMRNLSLVAKGRLIEFFSALVALIS